MGDYLCFCVLEEAKSIDADHFLCCRTSVSASGSQDCVLLEALSIFRKVTRAAARSAGATTPVSLSAPAEPMAGHTDVSLTNSPPGAPATPLCLFSQHHITQINAASSSSSSVMCPSGLREAGRDGTEGSNPPSEG